MQKPKFLPAIVFLLLLVNIATLTFLWIQYRGGHRHTPIGNTKDFVIKELSLTKTQQLRYDSLRHIHRRGIAQLNEQDRKLHDAMFENIAAPIVDSALLDSAAHQISLVEVNKQKITMYHFRELRKILTAEQQSRFDQILKDVIKLAVRPGHPRQRGEQAIKEDRDEPPPPEN